MSGIQENEPIRSSDDVHTRVNLILPAFVAHDGNREQGAPWNEGLVNNKGAILTVTRDMARLADDTTLYAGGVLGRYKNSEGVMSDMVGGVIGLERPVADTNLKVYGEVMLGGINGYDNQGAEFSPGAALTGGLKYEFKDAASGILKDTSVGVGYTVLPSRLDGSPANGHMLGLTLSKSF